MILIAAVDSAWAIGKGGRLLVKIPRDQKLFLEETLGKTVIMGGKLFWICRDSSRFTAGVTLC